MHQITLYIIAFIYFRVFNIVFVICTEFIISFESNLSSSENFDCIQFPLLINLFLQHERTTVKHSLIADPEGNIN